MTVRSFCFLLLFFPLASWADHVVATVGSGVITASQLATAVEQEQNIQAGQLAPRDLEKLVLERLENNLLLEQAAKNQGIVISSDQLQKAIASIAANNRLSVDQLYAQVKQANGLTPAAFNEEIRRQLIVPQLLGPSISASDIEAYRQDYNSPSTETDQAIRDKILKARLSILLNTLRYQTPIKILQQ